jgi:beta-lactamase regulating signal transducer with metallopeptidase domain
MTFLEPSRWIDLAFTWTWQTSWQASVLCGLVVCVQALFRRWLSPAAAYLLSLLVLVRLLIPAVPSSSWSALNLTNPILGIGPRAAPASPPIAHWAPPSVSGQGKSTESDSIRKGHSVPDASSMSVSGRTASIIWLLGVFAMLAMPLAQYRKLSQWLRRQERLHDPRACAALASAKASLGVTRSIGLIAAGGTSPPALFGCLRPSIILPQAALDSLTESELRMIFLHELAHVRRQDVLLNWLMIVLRAGHWFNPVLWLALRRLRRDRELVCDAMVMRVVGKEERSAYGNTLLKLLEHCQSPQLSSISVPVLNHKTQIKRRIIMIAQFKPLPRSAYALLTCLLALLGLLGFTKAAEQPAKTPSVAELSREHTESAHANERDLKQLQQRMDMIDGKIRAKELQLDGLRAELGGRPENMPTLDPETIRALERERITAVARGAQFQMLSQKLAELRELGTSALANALPTTVPDTELSRLLSDLNQAEARMATLQLDYGAGHPEIKSLTASISALKRQVKERVDGILYGLQAQTEAQRATAASLSNQVAQARQDDQQLAEKSRPYLRAKHDLEILQRVRDELMQQLLDRPGQESEAKPAAP